MAFFKNRKSLPKNADASGPAKAPAQSVEIMRSRAKHRLIGACVLVLVGVVGFPLLFDSQPRPVAADIAIDIPDKAQVKALLLPLPASAAPQAVVAAPAAASAGSVLVEKAIDPVESKLPLAAAPVESAKPQAPAVAVEKPVAKLTPAAPEAKPAAAAASAKAQVPVAVVDAAKPQAPTDDGAKAAALLEGKDVVAAAVIRYVVQVGAFSDGVKLREVRQKLEKAGLKTYTQVVDGKDGKRTRVRVGPFASQAEADKSDARVHSLELPATVLKM